MKIVVSSQVFYPDHSGIAIYASDFAFYAAEMGHEVHVVTSFPFYPDWQKRAEDRRKLLRKERVKNLSVYRGYTYARPNPSTFQKLVQEMMLIFFSAFHYLRIGKPDVIVVFTTPVSFGLLGYFFKKIYRGKLIINVQDFQIEAASSLSMLKGGFFLKWLSKIERFSYNGADLVTSISQSMVDLLSKKGVSDSKRGFWPNWIDTDGLNTNEYSGKFRSQFDIDSSQKIIAYAGNIGLKQGLSVLVDVANYLREREDILFLIIGDGSGLSELKKYAGTKQCKNVKFLPFLSPEEYHEFLIDVDMIFISQMKTKSDIYFPSKLLGIMARGKEIILSANKNSELYKVLKSNNVAYVTEYGDVQGISDIIRNALDSKIDDEDIASNAKGFVKNFERKVVLNQVLDKLEEL